LRREPPGPAGRRPLTPARLPTGDRRLLLALAVAHGGRFVTFDRALSLTTVHGATEEHLTVL
jgi:hypothetical protein